MGLLALLVLAAACRSGLDPDADVRVVGRVLLEDGSAAAGIPVLLVRRPLVGEPVPPGRFGDLLALGCLNAIAAPACSNAFRVMTGADGRFELALKGHDVLDADGVPVDVEVSAQRDPGAPSGSARRLIDTDRVELPDLVLWDGALSLASAGGIVTAAFAPAPGGGTAAVAFERATGAKVWEAAADSTGGDIDARLLEDGATLGYTVTRRAAAGAALVLRGRAVPITGGAGVPPSRGEPCLGQAATGEASISPCPLTDGDFESPLRAFPPATCATNPGGAGCDAVQNGWAYLDLREPRALSLAVVRGAPIAYRVQLSGDAASWSSVADGAPGDAAFDLSGSSARYVRVLGNGARPSLAGLREVSLW